MTNFFEAHERHFKDAEHLLKDKRIGNADHLYGISAECGLKCIMTNGKPKIDKKYKKHINDLWNEFHSYASGRTIGNKFLHLMKDDPFHDWKIDDRYEECKFFSGERTDRHKKGAQIVNEMVKTAKEHGLIP